MKSLYIPEGLSHVAERINKLNAYSELSGKMYVAQMPAHSHPEESATGNASLAACVSHENIWPDDSQAITERYAL